MHRSVGERCQRYGQRDVSRRQKRRLVRAGRTKKISRNQSALRHQRAAHSSQRRPQLTLNGARMCSVLQSRAHLRSEGVWRLRQSPDAVEDASCPGVRPGVWPTQTQAASSGVHLTSHSAVCARARHLGDGVPSRCERRSTQSSPTRCSPQAKVVLGVVLLR